MRKGIRGRCGLAGLTLLATMIACTDRIAAPTGFDTNADAAFTITGAIESSLWRVNGADVVYAGSVRGRLLPSRDKDAIKARQGAPTAMSLAPATIAATQYELREMVPATVSEAGIGGARRIDGRLGQTRRSTATPLLHRFTSASKQFETRIVADKRGGRPPRAVAISSGGQPISLSEYTWARDGERWIPERSRVTMYDGTGRATTIATHDFSGVRLAMGSDAPSANVLQQMGASLSRLVQPDVLYAMDECGEGGCLREALVLAASEAAWAAGVAALAAAIVACPTTGGLSCPLVIAAQLALVALDIQLGMAIADYYYCRNRSPGGTVPLMTQGSGEGALSMSSMSATSGVSFTCGEYGGGGTGSNCAFQEWEISYDDGRTWQYWGTFWTCDGVIT